MTVLLYRYGLARGGRRSRGSGGRRDHAGAHPPEQVGLLPEAFARFIGPARQRASSEVERQHQGLVDGLALRPGQSTRELAEALDIDGADLLDQDARALARERDLRAKRRRRRTL